MYEQKGFRCSASLPKLHTAVCKVLVIVSVSRVLHVAFELFFQEYSERHFGSGVLSRTSSRLDAENQNDEAYSNYGLIHRLFYYQMPIQPMKQRGK